MARLIANKKYQKRAVCYLQRVGTEQANLTAELGHPRMSANEEAERETVSGAATPYASVRRVAQPDPRGFDWTPAGTGGYSGRDLLNFRREAAHLPSRYRTRTLIGGEPAVLTGRMGGTDEFRGRGGYTLPPCRTETVPTPDPVNVFGAASCGCRWMNFAGAAAAKASTAIRETRETEGKISRIPRCAY